MIVIKRNGLQAPFDERKIVDAISKAMAETAKGKDLELAVEIANSIAVKALLNPLKVEEIQDMVEEALMDSDRKDVAKKYIIYRHNRSAGRDKIWPMTDLQRDIYEKKYRLDNESFGEFLDRVSAGNQYIRKLIKDKYFIPAGRILANRGLDKKGRKITLSNCFVNTPPQDNLESIFDVAKNMARVYSYGGGVGITLENLRPRGFKVNNSAKYTTGAVSFMELYSMTTGLIGQNNRRGALMISLPIHHLDIEEFIDIKSDLSKVNFANISVMVDDSFMKAVMNGDKYKLYFEVKDTGEYFEREVDAKTLFRKLAESNWRMAEPGCLFWDRVQGYHLNSEVPGFKYSSTNPCGEKPLVEDGNCLLSSFNLSSYVRYPFSDKAHFDFNKFNKDVYEAVRFMDDLLEEGIPLLPLKKQQEVNIKYRQLGLGVMGMADMFIKMGLTYASTNSLILINMIFNQFANSAMQSSAILAKERGSYPAYSTEVLNSEYFKTVANSETQELVGRYGLRNAELLSIAPTGSISTLWGVSGGIEPVFAFSHNRRSESLGDGEDVVYKVYADIVQEYLNANPYASESSLPEYFVSSHEIHSKDRINLQAIAQKYVDSAISSTINLPNEATVEDVESIYMYAWKKGLKGVKTPYQTLPVVTGVSNKIAC